jgi:uncharacterized protein (DUF2062 family)
MALKQSALRLYVKILQQEGTPESLARGVAIGLFNGMFFPVGTQTLPALICAFIFRANKVLSVLFTLISNPANVFLLYPIQCYTGSLIIGNPLKLGELNEKFRDFLDVMSMDAFMALGWDIIVSFVVGGAFYGAVLGVIGYKLTYRMVSAHRSKKAMRRLNRSEQASGMPSTVLPDVSDGSAGDVR